MTARENPFAPSRLERVLAFDPVLCGTTWEELERRWREAGCRGAITGRHGAGKTTLLRAWCQRLVDQGRDPLYLFFNLHHRRPVEADRALLAGARDRPVLIDGWDYLSWCDRLVLGRRLRCLLVTKHRGRGLIRLKSGPELAAALLARAAPGWVESFAPDLEARLAERSGNLRELWMDCYAQLADESN